MQAFLDWLAASPLASFLKVFLSTLAVAAVADWSDNGVIDFGNWQVWVIAACVAAVPLIINAANPQYPLYGRGKAVAAVEVVEK